MLNIAEKYLDKISELFYCILNSKNVEIIELPEDFPDNEFRQVVGYINRFVNEYKLVAEKLAVLANGELRDDIPSGKMSILQSLKTLHARLRHLTWKTQQITNGDLTQKIDFLGDFSEAFNTMTEQLKNAFDKIEQQNQLLTQANQTIKKEKQKSDQLLLNILPEKVADDLKEHGKTAPQIFDNVTVLFSDIVGFTQKTATIKPVVLVNELNEIFTGFDNIFEANKCERIKTIGDAYLAVCGMPEENNQHADNIICSAVEMIDYLNCRNKKSEIKWEIRVGIHSGKVIGAVVGVKKYIYDVFGDTINTASRMESNSGPMKITISDTTYDLVKNRISCEKRNPIDMKGKGLMQTYFVNSISKR